MTETLFTPGPWVLDEYNTVRANRDGETSEEVEIATWSYGPLGTDKIRPVPMAEAEANAHLIAASPAMYDALYVLEDYAQDRCVDAEEWEETDTLLIPVTIGDLRKGIAARKQARGDAS